MAAKGRLSLSVLEAHFPSTRHYQKPRTDQTEMLQFIADNGSSIIEAPTGSGKTAVEVAVSRAAQSKFGGQSFIITPNKAIVDQIRLEFPDLKVALGRNEHPCFYYETKTSLTPENVIRLKVLPEIRADEIPCSMLQECPHRVNQTTGKTFEGGAIPCPYLQQKFEAKQGGVVLSTMAFFLFTRLFSREFEELTSLAIDEAHRLPEVVRNALSYEITDYHLGKSVEILERIGASEGKTLEKFMKKMIKIIKDKPPQKGTLLTSDELFDLVEILSDIDTNALGKKVAKAIKDGTVDVLEDRTTLRKLEILIRDVRRYIRSFEFSMETDKRHPLNYTYAFYQEEKGENDKVQYKVVIKCYYVAALIKKLLPDFTVSLSATIGDPETFGYESGIKDPFVSIGSGFPAENTRIFMPTDTPDLAVNSRSKRDLPQTIRQMVRTSKYFAGQGKRSLAVVVSNLERSKFMMMAEEEGLKAISYGNGVTAKEASLRFKSGEGDVLVGTATNYAEGIDLPKQIAPIIFFLRPSFPNPEDPGTQFEERRFGGMRWALWNYRVMIQALQVRGRNVRSRSDVGVTFFMSQQFRRFLFAALPEHLQKTAYKGNLTFDQCVKDAEKLIG